MEKEYNKAYAVWQYVRWLSSSLEAMFWIKNWELYYFNGKDVEQRNELVNNIHKNCIEAIKLLKD